MSTKQCVLFLFLLLMPGIVFAGSTGKIKGKVTDKESKEALVGANVAVEGTTYGAATDVNGEYTILNIPAGDYTLKATFVGYAPVEVLRVRVNSDLTTTLDFGMSSEAVTLTQIEVIAQKPLINKDQTNTTVIKSADDINALPIRGVTDVAGLQASVVKNEGSNLLYVRGGRPEEVAYMIDGVSVNNPLSGRASNSFNTVNQNSVEELQIQTGGFNAEYGAAMSGVINLNTKSAYTRYTASAEVVTDGYKGAELGDDGAWGYNVYNLSFGGPIIPNSNVASIFLSGERQYLADNDPRAVGGVKPHSQTKSWNFNGKLTLKPIEEMDIKIGGYRYQEEGQNWDNLRRFYDSEHHQRFDNGATSGFVRLTHNVGTNMFYTLQGSYFLDELENGDGVWFNDLLSYGDVAKNPNLPSVGTNPSAIFSVAAAPGNVLDRYTKSKSSTITFSGDVSLQEGNHLVKLGGEYRMYKVRRFTVNPMGLAIPATGASQGWIGYYANNVEYYGYTFDGQSENDTEDYFGNQLEAPKEPVYYAVYLQDKLELADLTVNMGVRLDHFDAKEMVVKDALNPFGKEGDPGSTVFDANDLRPSDATTTLSPRIGFSFPVSDRATFHAQYGTFLQFPPLQYLLVSKTWEERMMSGDGGFSVRIPNPDLKPERTVSYELGFKTALSDYATFAITGFYKEVKDLIQARTVGTIANPAYPAGYESYENVDFGTVKGFDFIFELRRTKNVAATLNYTLGFANGTGSDPQTQSRISWIQTENPKVVAPLQFDRRHVGSINVDYRLDKGQGPNFGGVLPFERTALSLLFSFNSGIPYTQSVVFNPFFGGVTEVRPTGALNQAYTPWNFRFDLRLERGFNVGPLNLIGSVSVINLLNADNVVSVYVPRRGGAALENETGIYRGTGQPDNSGWLATQDGKDWAALNGPAAVALFKQRENNPENFGVPRQVRLGLRVEY